jgi:hypothetical protein
MVEYLAAKRLDDEDVLQAWWQLQKNEWILDLYLPKIIKIQAVYFILR